MAAIDGAAQIKSLPLLPYERELIELLGCSVEEYQQFASEVRRRGLTRPAAYDHIPDIRCDPVSIIVSLVIGVALSAASALLAPKPKGAEQDEITQRRLSDRRGASRFNQAYGFDTVAELAAYGTPVPIPFGFYQGPENTAGGSETYTGGIVVSPLLVWSRMLSYGSHQAFKAMYVVGETNLGVPDLNGVWLGTTPLDAIYEQQFALYWNKEPGSGRLKAKHLIAGTRGSRSAADTWAGDDVMNCPTRDGSNDPGFSMAYSPTGQSTFGVYQPVANGTDRRVNWRVISIPEQVEGRSKKSLKQERKKIATSNTKTMEGAGRGYSRLMGVIQLDGARVSRRTILTARIGSTAIFRISGYKYSNPFSSGVTVDDLRDESNEERIAADEHLQIGEQFLYGKSIWRVVDRTSGIWRKGKNIDVTLQCIEVFGNGDVGVVPEAWLSRTVMNQGSDDRGPGNHAQINFYPLLKADLAIVRNLRPADVTEIGFRSQVWGQMNGLCNFKTIPSPNELVELDEDNVNITSGVMNLYFTRYSFFTIHVRPAGDSQYGEDYGWEGIGEEFCIRGSTPVDQYNFVRLRPAIPIQYEYRLVPLSCAYITRKPENAVALLLNAKSNEYISQYYETPHGGFTVAAPGELVRMSDVEASDLMYSKGREGQNGRTVQEQRPSQLDLDSYDTTAKGRAHAYRWEFLGDPENYPNGHVRTVARTLEAEGPGFATKTVRVFFTATCVDVKGTNFAGQDKVWGPPTLMVNQTHPDTSDNWETGEIAYHKENISRNNPYEGYIGRSSITASYRVTVRKVTIVYPPDPGEQGVEFEHDTQIAEVSHYGSLIQRSCDSGPEHSITYVNECVGLTDQRSAPYNNMATMGLVLRANRSFSRIDQPRLWLRQGIKVEKLLPSASQFESSNNFAELVYWMLTNKESGLGDYVSAELVDREGMTETARFLEANRFYFDGVIEDRVNIRSFIQEVAPMMLCNFVIRNGRFSLVPAVPTDDAGMISSVAVPIAAMFTEGNIIEDSFKVEYLDLGERRDFQAVVNYRRGGFQQLPENKTVVVRWASSGNYDPQETFDLTQYCTRRGHAATAARYMLSVRRRIDHTVTFKTTPDGLALAPGEYIKVYTQANPYNPASNGIVLADDLTVISPLPLADGSYPVLAYRPGDPEPIEQELTVTNGKAASTELAGAVFSILDPRIREHVYLVEQLTLDEDGLVEIVGSYFPVDDQGHSIIAQDLLNTDRFVTLP